MTIATQTSSIMDPYSCQFGFVNPRGVLLWEGVERGLILKSQQYTTGPARPSGIQAIISMCLYKGSSPVNCGKILTVESGLIRELKDSRFSLFPLKTKQHYSPSPHRSPTAFIPLVCFLVFVKWLNPHSLKERREESAAGIEVKHNMSNYIKVLFWMWAFQRNRKGTDRPSYHCVNENTAFSVKQSCRY